MQRKQRDLQFPVGGISEVFSLSAQPDGTSRDIRNMRGFDSRTGRLRGAQRSGLGVHVGGNSADGSNKIQAINTVQREINPLDWASILSSPTVEGRSDFEDPAAGFANAIDMQRDLFGNYFVLADGGEVIIVNSDGQRAKVIDISVDLDIPRYARRVAPDQYGNFVVASGHEPGHSSVNSDNAWLDGWELQDDGSYLHKWRIAPGYQILDIGWYAADLYVWGVIDDDGSYASCKWAFDRFIEVPWSEEPVASEDHEFRRLFSEVSDTGHTSGCAIPDITAADYVLAGEMSIRGDGDVYVTGMVATTGTVVGSFPANRQAGHIVARLKPISQTAETPVWVFARTTNTAVTGQDDVDHGAGLGIKYVPKAVDDGTKSHFWTCGGHGTFPHITYWADDGNNISKVATATLDTSSVGWFRSGTLEGMYIRTALDDANRFYTPYHGAGTTYSGKHLLAWKYDDTATLASFATFTPAQLGTSTTCISVAAPVGVPDFATGVDKHAEYLIVGCTRDSGTGSSVQKVAIANATTDSSQKWRETKTVAACNGGWYLVGDSAFTALQDPDGNAISYDSGTRYMATTVGRGLIYWSDGSRYYQFDPENDSISRYLATSQGGIPARCRLMAVWRGRMVLARDDGAPGAWHMSREGDFYDWDQFANDFDSSQAFSATTSKAGRCPDSINSIVPYNDDVIWFGCDHSIWQLSGDPGNGGQFDLISDEVGMPWGRPWCKDDLGRIWFFGSKGGLYQYTGQQLVDVAAGKMRKRLRDIDLSTYTVELVYNYEDDGVHIFVSPYANPGTLVDHYYYCKRTEAFFIDRFGRNGTDMLQPTCAHVVDGDDPNDRSIMMGCEDGRVRIWARDSTGNIPRNDEITSSTYRAIDSYALIGPLTQVGDGAAELVQELTVVTAPNYGGCVYDFFSTDDPADLGSSKASGTLYAGRNSTELVRVSGDSVYVRLRNARENETWAYEKGTYMVGYSGEVRRQ